MKTNKTLIIVESPSKSKTIAKHLSNDYMIVASKGHIVDLAKGGKHGMGIDINNNFQPHYVILDDKVATLQEIMDATKQCSSIIICTDADREGEAIGQHIANRLASFGKPITRAEIHEITKKGILEGIKSTRPINVDLVKAQEGRRILDRLVGFSASPFLMNYFGPNLSAGRVQSVITRMITEREQEIEDFRPEDYFPIQVQLFKDHVFSAKYDTRITEKKVALQVKEDLLKKSTRFIVASVEATEEKKKPLAPLITAKLQQILSKQYKISSQRTMQAAQSLYERGLITYMRTDSVRVSTDALKEVRAWLTENTYDVPKSANVYKNKNNSQDAHEAIRPTDVYSTPSTTELSGDEFQVYEVIWKYFVASQMKPAIYDTLKVIIQTNGKPTHTFVSSGKALKYKGFLEILDVSDNSSIDIPNLHVGEEVELSLGKDPITIEHKQTQPPPRYSEASIIKTLEEKEIGRPATYAQLLSTITSRNYVEQVGNIFHPTALGKTITQELVKWFSFLEYNYTSEMEKKLDEIAEGKLDHIQMLKDFYSIFKEELKKAYINHGAKPCKKCDGMLRELTSKSGERFLGCNRYPRCYYSEKIEITPNSLNP